jgi:hypothetical protein
MALDVDRDDACNREVFNVEEHAAVRGSVVDERRCVFGVSWPSLPTARG